MLIVHYLRNKQGRYLCRSMPVTWLMREKTTSPVLVQRQKEKGVVLDTSFYDNYQLGVPKYPCTSVEESMHTLHSSSYVAYEVIDSFLKILRYEKMLALSSEFAFHLISSTTSEIVKRKFHTLSNLFSLAKILLPLNDISERHWFLADILKLDKIIEVFDSRHFNCIFANAFPMVLHWTENLRTICQDVAWPLQFAVRERMETTKVK